MPAGIAVALAWRDPAEGGVPLHLEVTHARSRLGLCAERLPHAGRREERVVDEEARLALEPEDVGPHVRRARGCGATICMPHLPRALAHALQAGGHQVRTLRLRAVRAEALSEDAQLLRVLGADGGHLQPRQGNTVQDGAQGAGCASRRRRSRLAELRVRMWAFWASFCSSLVVGCEYEL